MMVERKRCTKCGEVKNSREFYSCKNSYDGLSSWCRKCSYGNVKNSRKGRKKRGPSHKRDALLAVKEALEIGRLKKLEHCCICRKKKKLYAHHWSYESENYLNILWMCELCHDSVHEKGVWGLRDPDEIRYQLFFRDLQDKFGGSRKKTIRHLQKIKRVMDGMKRESIMRSLRKKEFREVAGVRN